MLYIISIIYILSLVINLTIAILSKSWKIGVISVIPTINTLSVIVTTLCAVGLIYEVDKYDL